MRGERIDTELREGARVSMLLGELSKTMPNLAQMLVDPTPGNLVIVGGVEIGNLQGMETPLVEGSEVVLVPVTHGGS